MRLILGSPGLRYQCEMERKEPSSPFSNLWLLISKLRPRGISFSDFGRTGCRSAPGRKSVRLILAPGLRYQCEMERKGTFLSIFKSMADDINLETTMRAISSGALLSQCARRKSVRLILGSPGLRYQCEMERKGNLPLHFQIYGC